jgi:hypothetical protein
VLLTPLFTIPSRARGVGLTHAVEGLSYSTSELHHSESVDELKLKIQECTFGL